MDPEVVIGEWQWCDDWTEFDSKQSIVREHAERFLSEMFGDRCPDFETDCFCCQRWKLLDELLANPFDKPEKDSE